MGQSDTWIGDHGAGWRLDAAGTDDGRRTLLHHLRHEVVTIDRATGDRNEQGTGCDLAGVLGDSGNV